MAERQSKPYHLRRELLVDWFCAIVGCIAWGIFFVILAALIW